MADLMFTAGLDDRQFRQGLRGIDRQSQRLEAEERKRTARSGRLSRGGGGAGLMIGMGSRLLLGGVGAVALRKMWKEAAEAVHEYAQKNDAAARSLGEMGRSAEVVGTAVGRAFTNATLGMKKDISELSALGAGFIEYWHDLSYRTITGSKRSIVEKMKQDEEATKQSRTASLIRDIGGPMQEKLLRLSGRSGDADALGAENSYRALNDRLNELERDGKLTGMERVGLGVTGRKLRDMEVAEARRSELRSFSGAVPRALRFAVSGGVDNQTRERVAERAAKEAAAQRDRHEAQLKKIAKNTARDRVARYGP